MKRRVLCIFVLILWGLVFCTMLSVRIEQLMIPEVVLTQADESEPSPHIALDSLFFDDTGMHLYRPREGTGWETGTRIYEEEINNYSVGENQLDLKFFGRFGEPGRHMACHIPGGRPADFRRPHTDRRSRKRIAV